MMQGLDGITTGYERRFDFPLFDGLPPTRYLLASVPRAGSTWLSHNLWATGCLGAPLEYLNFEPGGHGSAATHDHAAQIMIWRRSLQYRTSPNGTYGLKVFPAMLHDLQLSHSALLNEVMRIMAGPGSPRKLVRLRRRNRDAHAISLARASLSGIWRKEQEDLNATDEPTFSALAVERCRRSIALQEAAWDAMCNDLQVTPLELWFEDAVKDPGQAIKATCDYLNVTLDGRAAIKVPAIEQQSREGAQAWARHLAEEQAKARLP